MIGKLIKFMRQQSGYNQNKLGKLIGKEQNTISEYETGAREPSFKTVQIIADLCDFDIVFIDRNSNEHINPLNLDFPHED